MTTTKHILAAFAEAGIVNNRSNLLTAFNHTGGDQAYGFTLAAAAAMVLLEASGRSVWGHDPWDREQFPRGIARAAQPGLINVTQAAYKAYARLADDGYQPQGCGVCQLTWRSDQIEADQLGGCWKPYPNLLIGLRILKSDMREGGSAFEGFWSWNGRTPAGEQYARNAVAEMDRIQALINQ